MSESDEDGITEFRIYSIIRDTDASSTTADLRLSLYTPPCNTHYPLRYPITTHTCTTTNQHSDGLSKLPISIHINVNIIVRQTSLPTSLKQSIRRHPSVLETNAPAVGLASKQQ